VQHLKVSTTKGTDTTLAACSWDVTPTAAIRTPSAALRDFSPAVAFMMVIGTLATYLGHAGCKMQDVEAAPTSRMIWWTVTTNTNTTAIADSVFPASDMTCIAAREAGIRYVVRSDGSSSCTKPSGTVDSCQQHNVAESALIPTSVRPQPTITTPRPQIQYLALLASSS
jgi:hypothetical protein